MDGLRSGIEVPWRDYPMAMGESLHRPATAVAAALFALRNILMVLGVLSLCSWIGGPQPTFSSLTDGAGVSRSPSGPCSTCPRNRPSVAGASARARHVPDAFENITGAPETGRR